MKHGRRGRLAVMIGLGRGGEDDEHDEHDEYAEHEGRTREPDKREELAHEILHAIRAGNATELAEALEDFVLACIEEARSERE